MKNSISLFSLRFSFKINSITLFNQIVYLFPLIFCLSCNQSQKSIKQKTKKENIQSLEFESSNVEENEKTIRVEYSINVIEIDSIKYYSTKLKTDISLEKLERIDDPIVTKKMLKGVVDFNKIDNYYTIKNIHFKNGKTVKNLSVFDEGSFVAYFPTEGIILCEGGHSSDLSFNLATAEEIENIGNPDYIIFSQTKQYRFNGYFEGQECSSYFIQKKINNQYKKIIQLDKEFELKTGKWLCMITELFWINDQTIFLIESDFSDEGIIKNFYEIKIKEQTIPI